MGVHGYLIAFGCKVLTEFVCFVFILTVKNDINLFRPKISSILIEFKDKFWSWLFILFGVFGAVFTIELNTYFVVKTHDFNQIVTW